ncbi:MAG: MBL fold metallo-hydrolase [Christensenellales bacterium]
MAKKSSKSTKSKKQTASPVEKAAKKAYKANPKAFIISIVAIVLVIAIATAVVYFAFPDTWDKIVSMIVKDNQHSGLARGDGELLVHMLDVGQGDCIYIQLPDGKDMVIDCANYNDDGEYEKKTFDYLDKYIEDDTVEYLMLTHCDSDHVYFMDELLERYQVEKLFMPNVLAAPGTTSKDKKALQDQIDALDTSRFTDKDTVGTITYAEFFIAALTEPDCEIVLNVDPDANTNSIIIEETTYRLVFYCPTQEYYDDYGLNTAERKNAISPIGILEYNNRKIMLTGDSNEINEPLVMARTGKIDCDVLKVGHHGSETSTSNAFLDEYTFEYAIISCNSYGNKFNHPRQATLDRLKSHNIEVYRTDNNGNIVVSVDKDGNLKITTQKESTQEQNLIGLTGTSKS